MQTNWENSLEQLFTAFTVLFSAAEKTAKSLDNLAGWAEEGSAAFKDEAAINRQIQANELAKKLKASAE